MFNIKNIFNSFGFFSDLKRKDHKPSFGALDIFKYIGPGLLVTIGFIDPGNWAANIAIGSEFGYTLLWVISLSTIMLIVLQHNVFLHSEIIQSRQWNLEDEQVIKKQLKFEFADTLFSMIIGWAINSAMIILAAATFFKTNMIVNELPQAEKLLEPL